MSRRLLLLALFAAQTLFAQAALSFDQDISSLEGAELILFTSPSQCAPCKVLKGKLADSGQSDFLKVTSGGKTIRLKIFRFDPWDEKADVKYLKSLGYVDEGIPQFAVRKSGKVLGKGFAVPKAIAFTSKERENLLPESNENIVDYSARVSAYMLNAKNRPLDMTEDVLVSLNLLDVDAQIDSSFVVTTQKTNILIAGTATTPLDNPVFTGITIKGVIGALGKISNLIPTVLYGGGKSPRCDTCELRPGRGEVEVQTEKEYLKQRQLIKTVGLSPDESFTKINMQTFFQAAKAAKAERNLIVLVGHGAPDGAITWLETKHLAPEKLKKMSTYSGSENVLVSGNCFGGIMAQTMACGFMAAPPNLPAAGCWEDAASGKSIPDYISVFFKSLNDKAADASGDGKVSFIEAHSYAASRVDDQDSPYTTMDDLAANYFKENPEGRIDKISVNSLINDLPAKIASPAEVALLKELTKDLDPKSDVYLKDIKQTVVMNSATVNFLVRLSVTGPRAEHLKITQVEIPGSKKTVISAEEVAAANMMLVNTMGKLALVAVEADEDLRILATVPASEDYEKYFTPRAERLRTLARRLLYKSFAAMNPQIKADVERVSKCENQNIVDFLK